MAIYENGSYDLKISGLTYASCDLCGAGKQAKEITAYTLRQVPPERGWNQYEVENSAGFNNAFRADMNREGWTQEVFHGKSMLLCPKCTAL